MWLKTPIFKNNSNFLKVNASLIVSSHRREGLMKKILTTNVLLPITVLVLLLFIPSPKGLDPNAWHYFAIFTAVVLGLILEPLPPAAIGLIGVTVAAVFHLVHKPGAVGDANSQIQWALSGFGNKTVWLIFSAFMFSLGYEKTGLGRRISLLLVKGMGKSTLGLGYAISFADLILAPFTPSNTARSGGTIYPIVSNIPAMFNSYPDKNSRAMGSYLVWVSIATCCVTSSMFLTALAPNVLAAGILQDKFGIELEWTKWFLSVGLITIPLFLLTPLLAYWIYPPSIKKSPEVSSWASQELKKMGKISLKEILLLIFVVSALILWVFSKELKIDSTTTGILVVSLIVIFRVLDWSDILGNKAAFNVFIWFATLVALASGLSTVGFLAYLTDSTKETLAHLSPDGIILFLLLLFIVLHYFFASTTAHVTALLAVFMTLGIAVLPQDMAYKLAVMLAGSLGLMGIITPYGTGPSPIWYGSGFISQKTWWGLGFVFALVYFAIYIPLAFLIIN